MNSYDQYRQKSDLLGHFSEVLHENCFEACATKAPELPFLSVQEGLCFRNCVTKFSVFYPTLQVSLQNSDFRHYEDQILQESSKKDTRIKSALSDTREKESTKFFQEFVNKKQAQA